MHIPDAVLSPAVAAATSLAGAGGTMACLSRLRGQLGERTPVLMGTMSAFVFAAQMVNFPLFPPPISGHLLSGVLSAVLLGPWAGAVVIAAVLIVQCLLFGDGGLTALGANFVNMGLIGAIGGYAIYASIRRLIGGQSGVLIGGMVLRFLLLMRPDMVYESRTAGASSVGRLGQAALGGLGIALAVAVFLAPFASEYDDGLEWVGGKLGFLKEGAPVMAAPMPDYQLPLPGIRHVKVATAAAGLVGMLVVFGVSCGLAGIFSRRDAGTLATSLIREAGP